MKIAVSATGKNLESALDPRFGRAEFFIIYDTETDNFEAIENSAVTSSGGAGIATAQSMSDRGIKAVITGNVGPNAMSVLNATGIKILKGNTATVAGNLEDYKNSRLETIETTVLPHSGMGGHRGRE